MAIPCRYGHATRQYLGQADEKAFASAMRTPDNAGCPLGSDRFIRKLETLLHRRLRPRKRGRRRKKKPT